MNPRVGRYIIQNIAGEPYKAYLPPALPPHPPLDWVRLYPILEKATRALAELNSITRSIPNTSLFIYMYVRKEALLSNQIEGTQSSFSDLMLFEHDQKSNVPLEDVEEVSYYVKAVVYGCQKLKEGFPLSLRLLRDIHRILLSGGRGSGQSPGEWRRSQNWVGGTRPGNALFVPPPVEHLYSCLSDFEHFLHDTTLPILIKAGLAHVQFETIHPFLDGNGRLGRLLITLLLCKEEMLDEPILYLSLYLKQHRHDYYRLLQEVRCQGTWEVWLEFFLEGIFQAAKQALRTAFEINRLFEQDLINITSLGRARFSCVKTLEYLQKHPQVRVSFLAEALNITAPTARGALHHMVRLGILEETSGQKRDKMYTYRRYLALLEEGTEPLSVPARLF